MIIFAFVLAYLIGSVPNAYLIGKWCCGIDIRQHGSGNVGATNVFRTVGKKWGALAFILDVLKGFLAATLLASIFETAVASYGIGAALFQLLLGITAILGHVYPVWLGFKGGKGVATSCGVFLGIFPIAVLASLVVWVVIAWLSRYVSLASLIATASFLIWVILFYRTAETFPIALLVSFALLFFIGYTHKSNIRRLREGSEPKIGEKK